MGSFGNFLIMAVAGLIIWAAVSAPNRLCLAVISFTRFSLLLSDFLYHGCQRVERGVVSYLQVALSNVLEGSKFFDVITLKRPEGRAPKRADFRL